MQSKSKELIEIEKKAEKRGKFSVFYIGFIMGLAELIPGLGGGTVSYIIGIYEELMVELGNFFAIKSSLKTRFSALLFLLLMGIPFLGALILFSNIVEGIIVDFPFLIPFALALIIGLIIPGILKIGYSIKDKPRTKLTYVLFVIGFLFVIATIILGTVLGSDATITAVSQLPSMIMLFIIGIIIGLAMLVPGVGTAFILVVLGVYSSIVFIASHLRDAMPQAVVLGLGILFGIIAFTKIVNYLLAHHHVNFTVTNLGFLLGAVLYLASGIFGPGMILSDWIMIIVLFCGGLFFGSVLARRGE